jgi:two-component system, response regulator PdtaR
VLAIAPRSDRNGSVLVVEDETLLRITIADQLRDAGLAVLEASDADEAIKLLAARSDIGVVFTDLRMPGQIDGNGLIRIIRDRYPHVRVMAASAVKPQVSPDLFFMKPYDHERVIAAIARALRID